MLPRPIAHALKPGPSSSSSIRESSAFAPVLFQVPVNDFRRKSRNTNGDVFRSFVSWSAVSHPLTGRGKHCLAGMNFEPVDPRFHNQSSAENDGVLLEIGGLARLNPTRGAGHPCDTYSRGPRIYPANKLLDSLRLVAGSFDDRRVFDSFRHQKRIHHRVSFGCPIREPCGRDAGGPSGSLLALGCSSKGVSLYNNGP